MRYSWTHPLELGRPRITVHELKPKTGENSASCSCPQMDTPWMPTVFANNLRQRQTKGLGHPKGVLSTKKCTMVFLWVFLLADEPYWVFLCENYNYSNSWSCSITLDNWFFRLMWEPVNPNALRSNTNGKQWILKGCFLGYVLYTVIYSKNFMLISNIPQNPSSIIFLKGGKGG